MSEREVLKLQYSRPIEQVSLTTSPLANVPLGPAGILFGAACCFFASIGAWVVIGSWKTGTSYEAAICWLTSAALPLKLSICILLDRPARSGARRFLFWSVITLATVGAILVFLLLLD